MAELTFTRTWASVYTHIVTYQQAKWYTHQHWLNLTKCLSHECMFLGSLSCHNKDLERRTLKPSARHSSWTNRATALRQISVTALFYLEDSRRIQDSKRREWRSSLPSQGRERERERKRERERERERAHAHTRERERVREKALWLLLLYVFSSTWACPMQIGLSREYCLFCLNSSLWSSNLPLAFLVL